MNGRSRPLPACLLLFLFLSTGAPGNVRAGGTISLTPQAVVAGGVERTAYVPEGYILEVLAEELRQPRMITFAANGDLYAGSRSDRVYRMPRPYRTAETLVKLSGYPHSVALREGEMLIARTAGLYRAPYSQGQGLIRERDVTLVAPLPGGRGHNSRTVRIGPDGKVYVSLGISRNCSDEYLGEDYPFRRRRGGLLILNEGNGAKWQTFSSGLRNPVGFDWHPVSGLLYGSNNGPDHLGYDQPPEYFVRLTEGSFHGMPWFQFDGTEIVRDGCIDSPPPRPRDDVVPPAAVFPARSAPMAVAFAGEKDLGGRYAGDAVVALHGSWGTAPGGGWRGDPATRREPMIVLVRFDEGAPRGVHVLVRGFQLVDGRRWARPVGAAFGPDGALYFTSDEGTEGLFRLRRR